MTSLQSLLKICPRIGWRISWLAAYRTTCRECKNANVSELRSKCSLTWRGTGHSLVRMARWHRAAWRATWSGAWVERTSRPSKLQRLSTVRLCGARTSLFWTTPISICRVAPTTQSALTRTSYTSLVVTLNLTPQGTGASAPASCWRCVCRPKNLNQTKTWVFPLSHASSTLLLFTAIQW